MRPCTGVKLGDAAYHCRRLQTGFSLESERANLFCGGGVPWAGPFSLNYRVLNVRANLFLWWGVPWVGPSRWSTVHYMSAGMASLSVSWWTGCLQDASSASTRRDRHSTTWTTFISMFRTFFLYLPRIRRNQLITLHAMRWGTDVPYFIYVLLCNEILSIFFL